MTNSLKGIFVPNMVPLNADDKIDEAELRRYIEWLIESGIHGLYPNGSTGEFTRFTADERRQTHGNQYPARHHGPHGSLYRPGNHLGHGVEFKRRPDSAALRLGRDRDA